MRIGSCRICVDFSFPAMLALLFLQGNSTILQQTLAVCMLHELGHGIAMLATGAGIREIRCYAAGIQMRTHTTLLPTWKELLVLCSGPGINFAAAALLGLYAPGSTTAMLHLAMGIFNLLPYSMLDGGSILQCVFSVKPKLLRIQNGLCIVLSAGIIGVLAAYHIRNPFLHLMFLYLAAESAKSISAV